jgi:hypothetical protein
VRFAKDQHSIQALAAHSADQALRAGIGNTTRLDELRKLHFHHELNRDASAQRVFDFSFF